MGDDSIRDDIRAMNQTLGDFSREVSEKLGTILANQTTHQMKLTEHEEKIDAHETALTEARATMKAYAKIVGSIAALGAGAEAWFHKLGPWLTGGKGH